MRPSNRLKKLNVKRSVAVDRVLADGRQQETERDHQQRVDCEPDDSCVTSNSPSSTSAVYSAGPKASAKSASAGPTKNSADGHRDAGDE